MKKSLIIIFASVLVLSQLSCKKEKIDNYQIHNSIPRKVKFELYTSKDFSNYNSKISFHLTIKNATNTLIWDSVLALMKIKEIPKHENRIIIEKLVPNNDPTELTTGFYYGIENVGVSWYLDQMLVSETTKVVSFDFK